MTKPVRIQRKRTKGWRMPENTIYVGRPTKYGNPFTPEQYWNEGYSGSHEVAIKHCVDAYRFWLTGIEHWAHGELKPVPNVAELKGKNLACFCRLDQPCHADVLLEIANREILDPKVKYQ